MFNERVEAAMAKLVAEGVPAEEVAAMPWYDVLGRVEGDEPAAAPYPGYCGRFDTSD